LEELEKEEKAEGVVAEKAEQWQGKRNRKKSRPAQQLGGTKQPLMWDGVESL